MDEWIHCLWVHRLCCASLPFFLAKENVGAIGINVPRCGCMSPRLQIKSAIVGERGYPSSIDVFVDTSAQRTFSFADARSANPNVRYNIVDCDPPSADLTVVSMRSA